MVEIQPVVVVADGDFPLEVGLRLIGRKLRLIGRKLRLMVVVGEVADCIG